jgi:alpha-ribazole phosphatase
MNTTPRLLVIRHAETDMAGTFCGHSDPPLNSRGYKQLTKLLAVMKNKEIKAVYSSDLRRGRTTAKALAVSLNLPFSSISNLREIDFGDWEGATWDQVERMNSAVAQRWLDSYPNSHAPNGEASEHFSERVLTEVNRISTVARLGSVALVTHAGVMRVVLTRLCGIDDQEAWRLTADYCSYFEYLPNNGSYHSGWPV